MPVTDGSIRYITNSELQTFKRCRRKWWFAYWRKLTPIKEDVTGVRGLGTRLHAALASRYHVGGTIENAFETLIAGLLEDTALLTDRQDWEALDELQKDADLARIMLEGYFQWVAEEGVDIGLEMLGDEAEVSVPFSDKRSVHGEAPVHLLGRLDVRARREIDNARFFIDHKSVGSFSEATKMLHMNEQMLMYHLLEVLEQMADGTRFEDTERCDGGIYNMLRRVKRTTRAKPPFYAREEVHHNIHELRSFYQRVAQEVQDIIAFEFEMSITAEDKQHLVAYPTPTHDCSWGCDFVHACPMFDDGSRAEDFVSMYFTSYDPLDRYIVQESGQEDGVTE